MMTRMGGVALCLGVIGCSQPTKGPPPPAPATGTVEAELVKVLDRWYQAMERNDSGGTALPLTNEFLLLEDTLPLTKAQLVSEIARPEPGARQWRSERSHFETRVHGNTAWTTFANHETQLSASGQPACFADFIETVVFVQDGARWLIDRYHAAALHRWNC